ncbi:MAG TPA: hypothetical protein VFV87_12360 [Pirellulaceae bacterium]|nr:hypothetical protein [Pirellulaceae bacterium]
MKRSADRAVPPLSRRHFLAGGLATLAATASATADQPEGRQPATAKAAGASRPLRVAAINSIFRLRSHSYHILGRMVYGFQKDGLHHQPNLQVVRMFNDQYPPDDLSRSFCQRKGIELCKTAAETLGARGGLDVDAVALIVEHGDYPLNEYGQVLYPRYEYFQEVVRVFEKAGKSVPVFVDKHLSYDHRHAAEMVATGKKLGFGMMAGSSLPVTWRVPQIEPPRETEFVEAVATFGFDRGAPEIYFIHALEVLQCMLERRKGGETGIKSVVCLEGDAVWKAADEDRFSWPLVEEAVGRCQSANVGPIRENVTKPMAILLEYRDGTRGAVVNLIEATSEFAFAGRIRGRSEPLSCCFYLPAPPGARFFDPLTWHIEQFFHTGQPPYPVERTLLTSTILDLALHSRKEDGRPQASEALDIRYVPPVGSGFFRGPIADRE